MNIAVVGTGYVGLVTGTCLAETGNHVICVDIDEAKVAAMQRGQVPIYEPNLDTLFDRNIAAGRLEFTTEFKEAGWFGHCLPCLAHPSRRRRIGRFELRLGRGRPIGAHDDLLQGHRRQSTVPVGTADKVREAIAAHATVDFDVVSNPEFLREGFAVDDFMKPDRIVVGCSSERGRQLMEELYKPYVRQGNPLIFMDERSAD